MTCKKRNTEMNLKSAYLKDVMGINEELLQR